MESWPSCVLIGSFEIRLKETLQVDFERINHHSGQNFKSSETTPKTTEEWFQNIPCDVMKIIFKLYENDFKAFNYDIPIWLKNKIKC